MHGTDRCCRSTAGTVEPNCTRVTYSYRHRRPPPAHPPAAASRRQPPAASRQTPDARRQADARRRRSVAAEDGVVDGEVGRLAARHRTHHPARHAPAPAPPPRQHRLAEARRHDGRRSPCPAAARMCRTSAQGQPRGIRAASWRAARWLARGALHVLGILLGQQRREHAARDSGGPCYSPPSPIGPRDSGGSRYISQPYPLPLDQRAGRGRCGLPAPGQAGLTDRVPTGHQHPAATNPRLRPHATPPSSTGERGDCG
jgi:hypothetical protein